MTTQEAISRAALRKRTGHKQAYEHIHLALAEELQIEPRKEYTGPHPLAGYFLAVGFVIIWWLT